MHLIEGAPGTGKTTLALQFLQEAKRLGERSMYVTLSETIDELAAVAASHGWSLDGIHVRQLVATGEAASEEYTLYHPSEVELADLTKTILEDVDKVRPARMVIDSLSELRLLARDQLRYRRQILALKGAFAKRRCTVLMLDDQAAREEESQLRSIAHGVVRLEHQPFEYGRSRRRLRIVKMRGMASTEGYHDFAIVTGGLVVYPQLVPQSTPAALDTDPVRSGLAELDSLLAGGLTWGTTTLLIGPSGVGKSTIAAQYLCGAANPSARAAMFLFDERIRTFVARCDALGLRATERIASGHLLLEQVEPGAVSPGEFLYRVSRLVDQHGIRLVGIDTLNGYLQAIPAATPTTRLHELLSYLDERSVATFITLAQIGIIGSTMPVPIDLSYLADAIVLMRFFEAQGHMRKAISVVKKRTGPHESTIRELKIGPDRVQVGEPLTEFHGVLTGVPHYTGSSTPLLNDEQHFGRR